MEQDKILAVMGSPGSGKTTTAVKLAAALAKQKKNVIVVFCDPFTPVVPTLLPPDAVHDTSLGELLTVPGLTQADILNACVSVPGQEYISLLGYRGGESLMKYPKITRDKAVELFVSLRYLADYTFWTVPPCLRPTPHPLWGLRLRTGFYGWERRTSKAFLIIRPTRPCWRTAGLTRNAIRRQSGV